MKRILFIFIFFLALHSCKEKELDAILLPGGGERPGILASNPVEGQQGLSEDTLWVLFDRPMDQEKTRESFSITSNSGTAVGEISWESSVKMVFRPQEPLKGTGKYFLTVAGSAESAEGVNIENTYKVGFFSVEDRTPPLFVSSSPADGADQIPTTQVIRLYFSEPIDFSTASDGISVSPYFDSQMSVENNGTTIVIQPYTPLSVGSTYTITINESLTDLVGNPLKNSSTVLFTVGTDINRPYIVNVVAGSNTLVQGVTTHGVEKGDDIIIRFSEPMNQINAEAAISLSPSASMVKSWNVVGDTLTLSFPDELVTTTHYELGISSGATDLSGYDMGSDQTYPFVTDGANSGYLAVTGISQYKSEDGSLADRDNVQVLVPYEFIILNQFDSIELGHTIDMDYPGIGSPTETVWLKVDFNQPIDLQRNALIDALAFSIEINAGLNIIANIYDVQVDNLTPNSARILIHMEDVPYADPGLHQYPLLKLHINGGANGALDNNGNIMQNDYDFYFTYTGDVIP